MFGKLTNLTLTNLGMDNFINGYDIFNSKLLYYIQDPDLEKEEFLITTLEYRPDLIALEFYQDIKFESYVIMLCHLPITYFKSGLTIYLIPKDKLINIINNAGG